MFNSRVIKENQIQQWVEEGCSDREVLEDRMNRVLSQTSRYEEEELLFPSEFVPSCVDMFSEVNGVIIYFDWDLREMVKETQKSVSCFLNRTLTHGFRHYFLSKFVEENRSFTPVQVKRLWKESNLYLRYEMLTVYDLFQLDCTSDQLREMNLVHKFGYFETINEVVIDTFRIRKIQPVPEFVTRNIILNEHIVMADPIVDYVETTVLNQVDIMRECGMQASGKDNVQSLPQDHIVKLCDITGGLGFNVDLDFSKIFPHLGIDSMDCFYNFTFAQLQFVIDKDAYDSYYLDFSQHFSTPYVDNLNLCDEIFMLGEGRVPLGSGLYLDLQVSPLEMYGDFVSWISDAFSKVRCVVTPNDRAVVGCVYLKYGFTTASVLNEKHVLYSRTFLDDFGLIASMYFAENKVSDFEFSVCDFDRLFCDHFDKLFCRLKYWSRTQTLLLQKLFEIYLPKFDAVEQVMSYSLPGTHRSEISVKHIKGSTLCETFLKLLVLVGRRCILNKRVEIVNVVASDTFYVKDSLDARMATFARDEDRRTAKFVLSNYVMRSEDDYLEYDLTNRRGPIFRMRYPKIQTYVSRVNLIQSIDGKIVVDKILCDLEFYWQQFLREIDKVLMLYTYRNGIKFRSRGIDDSGLFECPLGEVVWLRCF